MASEIISIQRWILSPIVIPLLAATMILTVIYYWQQQSRFYRLGNKIPGPKTVPFFGNALLAIGKNNQQVVEYALEQSKHYGNIARGWIGNELIVFLSDPDDVEVILSSQKHLEKSNEYRFFKPWLGDGLLISKGEKWRSHRKLIAPAFHMNVLKTFVDIFNSNSRAVSDRMEKEIGKVFDVHDYMSEATVDILLETAMGTKRTTQSQSSYDYAMAVMKMCDIIHQRHYKLLYRFEAFFKLTGFKNQQEKLLGIIHGLTKKVLKYKKDIFEKNAKEGKMPSPSLSEIIATEENKQQYNKDENVKKEGLRDDLDDQDENDVGAKRRLAFLDLMIETAHNGADLTETDIKEEVDTIMFEGHDTTAAGSSFVLCLLGIHTHVQDKVYEELKTIFGDSDRPATFADTVEMKYLERVIFETLRMYPPVPVIARKINEDVKLVSGDYILPAGCTVVIGTIKIHRLPEIYPNPNVFDPDNFLPERAAKRHYYSYIPFSAGPRSCVGRKYAMLKLKILISTLLRRYRIKSNLTEEEFKFTGDIILKRADGFRIEIEKRET